MHDHMLVNLFALAVLALAACGSPPDAAPPAGAPPGERFGDGVPIARPLPRDLRLAHPAAGTAREGDDFGWRLSVPPGRCSVELGFAELVLDTAGVRAFAVLLNGKAVLEDLDLVKEAGKSPAVLVCAFEIDVPDGGLEVRLVSRSYHATIAWIALECGGARYLVDCGGDQDLPAAGDSAPLGEAIVAGLGSRFLLDLQPQWSRLETSPLGKFAEKPKSAVIGFTTEHGNRSLPIFDAESGFTPFDEVREERSLTSVKYHVKFDGLEGTITLCAPFHPGDRALSSLPVICLRFELRRVAEDAPREPQAGVFLPLYEAKGRLVSPEAKDFRGVVLSKLVNGRLTRRGLFVGTPGVESSATASAEVKLVDYGAWVGVPLYMYSKDSCCVDVLLAAHVADSVLLVDGAQHRFQYAARFETIDELARHAATRLEEALRASAVVDSLAAHAVLPEGVKELMASALPSFLMNTFLTESEQGEAWYSCLEGYCRFHSTVDVEYNAAPFYFWFAPDLLRHLLEAWPRHARDGFLAHDMGLDGVVGEQKYPHDMPVEENTNYVQLLHHYWVMTGDEEFAKSKFEVVRRLLAYVIDADKDGDGFAEEGTANTIDDASPAVQVAREQTYLGVKCAAAFLAGAELADAAGDADAAARYREQAGKIRATLEAEAWLGDHFALCVDRSASGLIDPLTRRAVASADGKDELDGWDAAHPHTALGLLYLQRAGMGLPLDEKLLRQDLATAAARTERRYGSAHSELEDNSWVSLNLFRDAAQCYLGDDVLDRTARYAELQRVRARATDTADWAGFCDSPYNRHLSYYPRGVAVFALVDAAAGFALDRRAGTLRLRPVRAPLRVPLPALADWPALCVPWFQVTLDKDGAPQATISEQKLLEGLRVTIDLSLVGGESREL
ncbi:MAG: DUF4965 domain-containing protein [Planctomycetes bacterium]|nr:DUF4965 domain-containing protein [Planctomycetota bacterium]